MIFDGGRETVCQESLTQAASLTAPSSEGALGFPTPTWNMKNPAYDRSHRSEPLFYEALPYEGLFRQFSSDRPGAAAIKP